MRTCPNCGANIGNQPHCPYCGDSEDVNDYSSQLEATQLKREIRELQSEIDKEQKEIDKLNDDHSSNGCFFIGVGLVIGAALLIAAYNMIFRQGRGIQDVIVCTIIALPIMIVISRFCDNSGNEEHNQEVNRHKRQIKKLNKEISELNKGITE